MVQALIQDRDELMYLEKKTNISQMSIDGKKAVIYILTRIYELCGLKPSINRNGEIEQIATKAGDILYIKSNMEQKTGFQAESLVIALTIISALLCICYSLSMKKQIYEKGGRYDGFNEKKAA